MDSFLKQFSKENGPYSHVSYTGGKYFIPKEEYTKFTQLYHRSLLKGHKMHLVERHLGSFCFFQDIDTTENTKLKDSDISEIILATLDTLPDDTEYLVSKRQDRYHVNYSYRCTPQEALDITEKLQVDTNLKKHIDRSVYGNKGLRMLGSHSKKGGGVYKVYNLETQKFTEFADLGYSDFEQSLLNADTDGTCTGTIKTKKETMSQDVQKDLSKLLGNLKTNIQLRKQVPNIELLDTFDLTPTKIKFVKNPYSGLTTFYITITDTFCPFKHSKHTRDSNPVYIEMSHKGFALRCHDLLCKKEIFPTKHLKLPVTHEFTKEYSLLCKYLTVKYYTSEVEMDELTKDLVEKSITGTNYSVAKVIFHLCKDTFRIDEMKNTEWYTFNGHRWIKSYKLHIFISEDLPKYYRSIKMFDNTEGTDESETMKYNLLVDKLIVKLETSSFKKSVIEELKYLFHELDPHFASKLDSNVYLLGFENGVYDLKKQAFRKAEPNDYISFTTGYDYIDYDPTNDKCIQVSDFIAKIITDPDVREYTLKVLGRSLLGIPDEHFYVWTGLEGSNGKSTLVSLLEKTLGDYAITCDTSLLTEKRGSSSSASPDAFEMKGRRLLLFAEPEKNSKLRVGFMKQMTGGDTLKARELFKSLVSFKCQGTLVMCTNELPQIDANDGGTWRRIRVTEYTSVFCSEPRKSKPREFKIDPKLGEKMNDWLCYFMSTLVFYYNKGKKEGLKEPKQVLKATNSYKGDNDNFDEFFTNCIKSGSFTPLKTIYDELASWWSENYSKTPIPSVLEVKRALRLRYGQEIEEKIGKSTLKGFKLEIIHECQVQDDDF